MQMKKVFKTLNNMKVKRRLIVCFLVVVILCGLSGLLGAALLLNTDAQYSEALVNNGFSQGEIGDVNTYLNKSAALVRDVIFLNDAAEVQEAREDMEENLEKMESSFTQLKTHCNTEAELVYIAAIEENLPRYQEPLGDIIELGLKLQNDAALEMFREKARPYLEAAQQAAEELMELNVEMGEEVSVSLTAQSYATLAVILIVVAAACVISMGIANYIAQSFSVPIQAINKATFRLAEGYLDIELSSDTKDEIGEMTRSFQAAANMLKKYVSEISRSLEEVADGNFNIETEVEFKGDFIALGEAVEKIVVDLSSTMKQINEASEQVTMGSVQMAESAQSLAEGATDQAGAVEELSATIQSMTGMAADSAEKSISSYQAAKGYAEEAKAGNREMQHLTEAMQQITETSKEIESIIAEIEDIASQTNLLSLNASIEAARAGEAGKGFAVVADQIGKLASDSAASAVNTRGLIGRSLEEIERGNEVAGRTSQTLGKMVEGIGELADSSRQISETSRTQADSMKQIEQGIEQISSVIQNNSASAEETSATSEELSAQAENLRALVEQFKLRNL